MARVFVNRLDDYISKSILKAVSDKAVGTARKDEEEEEEEGAEAGGADGAKYEVIGTLRDEKSHVPLAKEIVPSDSKTQLMEALLTCDAIVYNISDTATEVEEAMWAIQELHEKMSSFATVKVFVCVSTVLTWAKTKPLNPDEPDVPFTEEDYRRRRTHPNFKEHITAEKEVIKLGKTDKSKLQTYVVASGLQYGAGEDIFHYFFKSAWMGREKELPVFGDGQNVVPTIHVDDLASIIFNVIDSKPKTKYILAVDESNNTLEDLVRSVSKGLSTGRISHVSKEDGLIVDGLTQMQYDELMVSLLMEGTCIKEEMKMTWVAESGLIENMPSIIVQYKEERGLLPIKICILGPPAVGKTTVASQLCKHYKLHHVKMADVIKEALELIERRAARSDSNDVNEDDDEAAQEAKDYLEVLKDDLEENKGRYSTQHIIKFFKDKLQSMPCQNQGFVLDGFPKTEEEARELFGPEEKDDDDGEQDPYNKALMPELVVSLDADNAFLKERVINLPQSQVAGTHNNEEGLLRRLKSFREQNEEDVTVLNYFDELEIHPLHIRVSDDTSENMSKTVEDIKKVIKEPRNYGLTPEEKEILEKKEREEKVPYKIISCAG
ncbi:PREDICTED: adenylate kinase 7-like isoform X1 [Amphimedon queenslandica]|uniref:Uncharacterized protein n=1 Tax=Amphimedon queenslandica TaxID=400682 RepID=A0AAN0J0J7_AMPQE|nr:PREDICTED: adenylate kinase 7-like isoform X1 [Amphimedon queenslandica]|eukprot:XP_019850545.1 PREDICTED: adenylate kinase 7-like isoform X1 [Amphimedon queenslandica]